MACVDSVCDVCFGLVECSSHVVVVSCDCAVCSVFVPLCVNSGVDDVPDDAPVLSVVVAVTGVKISEIPVGAEEVSL